MDNSEFRGQVGTKVEELAEAFRAFYKGTIVESSFDAVLDKYKLMWREMFLDFNGSSSGDAHQSAITLENGAQHLRKIASDELGTPLESIRRDIGTWHGAAKTSFDDYLNGVENALQYQRECCELLSGMLKIQARLIDAGHEYALEIADQAIASLKKVKRAEDRRQRQMLADIVGAVAGGIGLAATGGVAGMIGGAITAIGGVAKSAIGQSGGGPPEVIAWMCAEVGKAKETINEDRRKLGVAIDTCHQSFFADTAVRSILPPEVGVASVSIR